MIGIMEEEFGDPEAFSQLNSLVSFLFQKLATLQSQLNGVARKFNRGPSMKGLYRTLESVIKESGEVHAILARLSGLPDHDSEDTALAAGLQKQITSGLTELKGMIPESELDIPRNYRNARTNSDWTHLNKGAINQYVKRRIGQPQEPIERTEME